MPSGQCLCGGVKLDMAADASKVADVYCHCSKCTKWGVGVAASMAEYKMNADGSNPITITSGKELVKEWTEKGVVIRAFCSTCGTHLYCNIPSVSVVATGPGLWECGLNFKPSMHAHYEHHKVQMNDGLPKFKNLPTAFGGSGEMIAEC